MTGAAPGTLLLEPVVRWPRRMAPRQRYLVEVDLRVADPPGAWHHDQEEFVFSCLLEGAPQLRVEAGGDHRVVVHRYGGSYGPARFVVTARGPAGPRALWLTICTRSGVPVRTAELPLLVAALDERAEPTDTGLPEHGSAGEPEYGARVVVRLRTDPIDRDLVQLDVWGYHSDGSGVALVRGEEPVTQREAASRLPGILGGTPWADDGSAVDFVLPRRILSWPVDQWHWPATGTPVGAVRPVWVRALSRMPGPYELWRRRAVLREYGWRESPALVHRFDPRGGRSPSGPADWSRAISAEAVCVLLPALPEAWSGRSDPLSALVDAGVPVVLRDRRSGDAGGADQIGRLATGPLLGLPDRVLALRRAALASGDPGHPGRHLTFYWDVGGPDPDPPLAAP